MNKVFTDNGWKDCAYWQTEDGVLSMSKRAVLNKNDILQQGHVM